MAEMPGIPRKLPAVASGVAPSVLARPRANAPWSSFWGINSLFGRRTAGMYIGRDWRAWYALGEEGVEVCCLSTDVLRGETWFEEGC